MHLAKSGFLELKGRCGIGKAKIIQKALHTDNYKKFVAMIFVSTAIMLGLMYLNTYSVDHVYWKKIGEMQDLIGDIESKSSGEE